MKEQTDVRGVTTNTSNTESGMKNLNPIEFEPMYFWGMSSNDLTHIPKMIASAVLGPLS